MKEIIYTILGIDRGEIAPGAETNLVFTNDPGSWRTFVLVAVFALLIYGIFWLYRREMKSCPRRVRMTLAILRTAVLVVLAVVLLRPVLESRVVRPLVTTIVVLVDDSYSMKTADQYVKEDRPPEVLQAMLTEGYVAPGQPVRRIDQVNYHVSRENGSFLDSLSGLGRVVVRAFSNSQQFPDIPSRMARVEAARTDARAGADRGGPSWIMRTAVTLSALGLITGFVLIAVGVGVGSWKTSLAATVAALVCAVLLGISGMVLSSQAGTPAVAGERPAQPDDPGVVAAIDPPPPVEVLSNSTNIALELKQALQLSSEGPLAGIVLFSDGRNNEGKDPREVVDQLRQLEVPLYVVGVGDTSEPPNVKVADVYSRESVWKGDPFEIRTRVATAGLGDTSVRVVLEKREKDQQASETIATKVVSITGERPFKQVAFNDVPKEAGSFIYTVRVKPQLDIKEEVGDNAQGVTVRVLEERARVLLIAGSPTWEYRAIRMLLEREKSVTLSCWLQSLDSSMKQDGTVRYDKNGKVIEDARISYLPQTFEDITTGGSGEVERIGLNRFDVILMLDPDPSPTLDPRQFSEDWNKAIEQFVSRGGGVLYMAGPKYTADFITSPRTNRIERLLPVKIENPTGRERDNLTRSFRRPWTVELTPDAFEHPIMRFADDSVANRHRWEQVLRPQVYWSFPATRAKAGAMTLIDHDKLFRGSQPAPLLVTGQYEAGRTVYVGFDSTWRWRRAGRNQEYFDRFWVQMVRYLVEGKFLGQKKRGFIKIEKPEYDIGALVPVTITLRDRDYAPLSLPEGELNVKMTVTDGEKPAETTIVSFKPVATEASREDVTTAGRYQKMIPAKRAGRYEFSVDLAEVDPKERDYRAGLPASQRDKLTPIEIRAGFDVVIPQKETSTVRLDRVRLMELAEASGGKYYTIDQVSAIPGDIKPNRERIVSEGRPQELWDTHFVLLLLAMLLTVEWGVRKIHKLM